MQKFDKMTGKPSNFWNIPKHIDYGKRKSRKHRQDLDGESSYEE